MLPILGKDLRPEKNLMGWLVFLNWSEGIEQQSFCSYGSLPECCS